MADAGSDENQRRQVTAGGAACDNLAFSSEIVISKRHTRFGSGKTSLNNAIVNGALLHEVRELAGHNDIRTTELYFVRKEQDAERAARRIAIR